MRMFRIVCLKHTFAISLRVLHKKGSRQRESIGMCNMEFLTQKREEFTEGEKCRSLSRPGQFKVCSESHAFPRAIARPQMLPQDWELWSKS